MERKIKTKQNLSKIRVTNNLLEMNKEVKSEQKILDKYKKEFDKNLNYIDKNKEIQIGWKKMGIKYLTSKAFTPRKKKINSMP